MGWAAVLRGLVGPLLEKLLGWLPVIFAFLAGKQSARSESTEEVAKVRGEQLEIASRPDASRDDILERMLDGDL